MKSTCPVCAADWSGDAPVCPSCWRQLPPDVRRRWIGRYLLILPPQYGRKELYAEGVLTDEEKRELSEANIWESIEIIKFLKRGKRAEEQSSL